MKLKFHERIETVEKMDKQSMHGNEQEEKLTRLKYEVLTRIKILSKNKMAHIIHYSLLHKLWENLSS